MYPGCQLGEISAVVDKQYLTRQATTLLKFAQSISDPRVSAKLIEKAADLKDRVDVASARDTGPRAPDVQSGGTD
jgi:hypothetical protein